MVDSATIDVIARAHDAAEQGRHRIRPPSIQYERFAVDADSAIQRHWVALKVASGDEIESDKIRPTSRAMQRQVNTDEPGYGPLGSSTSRFE